MLLFISIADTQTDFLEKFNGLHVVRILASTGRAYVPPHLMRCRTSGQTEDVFV